MMKISLMAVALFTLVFTTVEAQEFKETAQPLSKNAMRGQLFDITKDENGTNHVTYRMKVDKKSDVVSYEKYSFDADLKFLGSSATSFDKEVKPDIERTYYSAYVGGTGFEALRVTLKLGKATGVESWNHKKQRYEFKKWISTEEIKAKNDNGRVYIGYASYSSADDNKSNVFVIAKTESKDKEQAEKFSVLLFDEKLELKDLPVDLKGTYSLVYSDMLESEDVVMVFAPKTGTDLTKYVYFKYDIEGNLKDRVEFNSPASALLISAAFEEGGNVYFFGSSVNSKESYKDVFSEYWPIHNPGAAGLKLEGNNKMDVKWKKCLDGKMDNFHFLKFTGNQLVFASTTPVKEFDSKFKTAPGDRGASVYKGKKFNTQKFYVSPSGDYLVAGQLTGWIAKSNGESIDFLEAYKDIICFQFDSKGNVKAQYGIGKENEDKASDIFQMVQNFYPSADGQSVYWEMWEVKGDKDWFSGSISPVYFPRIVKVDVANSSISAVQSLGSGKYYLKDSYYDDKNKSILYFGNDLKGENLWIGKVVLK